MSQTVFIVTEGGTKITSLMTGAVALRSDRRAITSAVAPPAERYRFEFRRSAMVKTHYSFYPLAAFFTSPCGTGCTTCLYIIWGVHASWLLGNKKYQASVSRATWY